MRIILLVVLVGMAAANNRVDLNCGPCSNASNTGTECISFNGAGIAHQEILLQNGATCSSTGQFPAIYDLTCNASCLTSGCHITSILTTTSERVCSDTPAGKSITSNLDWLYGQLLNTNPSQTANWCSCQRTVRTITVDKDSERLSDGQVVGIALGVAAFTAILTGLIAYCCCCKDDRSSIV